MKNVMQDIKEAMAKKPVNDIELTLLTDSNAARAMCHRSGVGRVRHLQIRYLWVQQALKDGLFKLARVDTKENASDVGTKPLGEAEAWKCMSRLGLRRCKLAGFNDVPLKGSDEDNSEGQNEKT